LTTVFFKNIINCIIYGNIKFLSENIEMGDLSLSFYSIDNFFAIFIAVSFRQDDYF